ncbi:MAG: hypothetical protein A3C03_00295 [Candidatus Colwellbacteria bacterium RIFCSPHIGHO2_02_FULL_45_17]|uniref:Uncharacterized protein n=2 Tax=Candidatus Colwelliibacteriota TaxID=1817904 RepID=A0A1G1ZCA2_9BACT|nr:MAG: hypothetical protein A3C03_00295 [Candidatus Colwellbacteria bacterium RIFCSPHIGHO2_02_FULL_45_17]OGY61580.1 MAG: hypothetical protein A3I33_00470 [Candidatus Colwellbacteria bacterium RIFCSPLOWO2_02_FULL_45_11]OGY62144.1 MAG: hypothetical protein A3G58_02290 [Candidatus Colwellbacteria bacterium RIFCSPLOWO2_12_FULL_46_17]
MPALLTLDSKSFHGAPESLLPQTMWLDVLTKLLPRHRWSGQFVRNVWKSVTRFPRVENGVETSDGKFWRWGLRYATDDVVAFILLPEPDNDEPIVVVVEDGVDDRTATRTLQEPLFALAGEFRKKLREYSRKI